MVQREDREIPGLRELTCPKCRSQHIMTLRGEITAGKHTVHECKCKNCNCDFLVTSSIMRK